MASRHPSHPVAAAQLRAESSFFFCFIRSRACLRRASVLSSHCLASSFVSAFRSSDDNRSNTGIGRSTIYPRTTDGGPWNAGSKIRPAPMISAGKRRRRASVTLACRFVAVGAVFAVNRLLRGHDLGSNLLRGHIGRRETEADSRCKQSKQFKNLCSRFFRPSWVCH